MGFSVGFPLFVSAGLPEGAGRKAEGSGHRVYSVEGFLLKHMGGSENGGFSPQIIHFDRVFHYKPSILGYPYFWKPPYTQKSGRPSFFCQNFLHDWGRRPGIQAGTKTPWDTGRIHHGLAICTHCKTYARNWKTSKVGRVKFPQNSKNWRPHKKKNRWGFSCVFLQGVLRSFVFCIVLRYALHF